MGNGANETAPPTMQQIAKAAGVSSATVSLALRDHPRFPKATCERIQAIARKMGYRPNPYVSALMTHVRSSRSTWFQATLAFLNAFPHRRLERISESMVIMHAGAERRAHELGYELETFWTKEPGMTSRRLTKILYARGVSGIVVGPLPTGRGHLSLDWSRFAAASIGYSMWRPNLNRVSHYHVHGLSLALRNVRRLGYRRIGLAMPSNFNERVDQNWLGGLLVFQRKMPTEERVPPLLGADFEMRDFPAWFREHRPDVVMSPHAVCFDWLGRLRLRVPEDVGFVHLDRSAAPWPCAGVDQKPDQIAAAAVDLVVSQLHHNQRGLPATPKLIFLEGEWVDGNTVRDLRDEAAPAARKRAGSGYTRSRATTVSSSSGKAAPGRLRKASV